MIAAEWIASLANIAAAVGVVVVVFQLALARREMRATFERSFVDKYDRVIVGVPLSMLLGDNLKIDSDETAMRAFFDYFELCEEELYYRTVAKISSATWNEWWEGISLHMRRPAFQRAWELLRDRVAVADADQQLVRIEQFTQLRQAVSAIERNERYDPCDSWRRFL